MRTIWQARTTELPAQRLLFQIWVGKLTFLNAVGHGHFTDIEVDSAALLMIFAPSLPDARKDLVVAETSQSLLVRAQALGNVLLAITSLGRQHESARASVNPNQSGELSADGLHARFYQRTSISPGSLMSTLLLLSSIPIVSRSLRWTQTLEAYCTGSRPSKTSTTVCRPGFLLEGR